MTSEAILFLILAAAAIATAVVMVTQRNPLLSAIALIGNFFCLAAFYLLLQAQFLAVLQVIVYTGAIMVLVIFVIMLLNLGDEERLTERYDLKKGIGVGLIAGLAAELLMILILHTGGPSGGLSPAAASIGTAEAMGDALFGKFLLPFEATSILLLAAIVGAVLLARRTTR